MSLKTLCIWIIVAGVLGGIALGLFSRMNTQLASEASAQDIYRSLDIDANRVNSVRVEGSRGIQVLEQAVGRSDQWVIRWTLDGLDHSWDAGSAQVNSGIRALATVRVEQVDDDEEVFASDDSILVEHADGKTVLIGFAQDLVGGQRNVLVEERDAEGLVISKWSGKLNNTLHRAFFEPGILDWRSGKLFGIALSELQAIRLDSGDSQLLLNRKSNRWMIAEPFELHADQGAVHELAKSLLSLEVQSFVDDSADPSTLGFHQPIAQVEIRTNDGVSILRIGSRASVAGTSVYAEFEANGQREAVVISTEQLSNLTAVGQAYASLIPSLAMGSQIHMIRVLGKDGVARLLCERSGVDWFVDERVADRLNQGAIDRLLSVALQQPAAGVQIVGDEVQIEAFGSVELVGKDGVVLDRFEIALDSDETGMRLLLIKALSDSQSAYWICNSEDAIATGAWLTAVAGKRVQKN